MKTFEEFLTDERVNLKGLSRKNKTHIYSILNEPYNHALIFDEKLFTTGVAYLLAFYDKEEYLNKFPEEILQDKNFIQNAVVVNKQVYRYINKDKLKDVQYMTEILALYASLYDMFDERLKKDVSLLEKLFEKNHDLLEIQEFVDNLPEEKALVLFMVAEKKYHEEFKKYNQKYQITNEIKKDYLSKGGYDLNLIKNIVTEEEILNLVKQYHPNMLNLPPELMTKNISVMIALNSLGKKYGMYVTYPNKLITIKTLKNHLEKSPDLVWKWNQYVLDNNLKYEEDFIEVFKNNKEYKKILNNLTENERTCQNMAKKYREIVLLKQLNVEEKNTIKLKKKI